MKDRSLHNASAIVHHINKIKAARRKKVIGGLKGAATAAGALGVGAAAYGAYKVGKQRKATHNTRPSNLKGEAARGAVGGAIIAGADYGLRIHQNNKLRDALQSSLKRKIPKFNSRTHKLGVRNMVAGAALGAAVGTLVEKARVSGMKKKAGVWDDIRGGASAGGAIGEVAGRRVGSLIGAGTALAVGERAGINVRDPIPGIGTAIAGVAGGAMVGGVSGKALGYAAGGTLGLGVGLTKATYRAACELASSLRAGGHNEDAEQMDDIALKIRERLG